MSTDRGPSLDTKRTILAKKSEAYRAQAWEAEQDADMLSEQGATENDVASYRLRSRQWYALANACDTRLAKLPQPKMAE